MPGVKSAAELKKIGKQIRRRPRLRGNTDRAPRDPQIGRWSVAVIPDVIGLLAELTRLENREDVGETWVVQTINGPTPAGEYLVAARRFA